MAQAYLNGRYLPLADAKVSVLDRGFLFGDGVYEVIRVYRGVPFLLGEHLDRLRGSLDGLRIAHVDVGTIGEASRELVRRSGAPESTIYVQVTRGAPATRSHTFPVPKTASPYDDAFPSTLVPPTILAFALPFGDAHAGLRTNGAAAKAHPDMRWSRRDIKSVNLLGNVFAAQAAKEGGVYEAILVDADGLVSEGSHTNVFAVIDGTLRTMPSSERILPGITRAAVLRLAKELGLPIEERGFTLAELAGASELMLTGTTTEVTPVTRLDGKNVGDGEPGPMTRQLQVAYSRLIEARCGSEKGGAG